ISRRGLRIALVFYDSRVTRHSRVRLVLFQLSRSQYTTFRCLSKRLPKQLPLVRSHILQWPEVRSNNAKGLTSIFQWFGVVCLGAFVILCALVAMSVRAFRRSGCTWTSSAAAVKCDD